MSSYQRFETELAIRPDDIDVNNHLHFSTYLDYVLAARYDQMERCYGMAMDEFLARGFNWVVRSVHINFKRSLVLRDRVIVRTGIESIETDGVHVAFEIWRKDPHKLAADGVFDFTMIDVRTGRAISIPPDIIEHYTR